MSLLKKSLNTILILTPTCELIINIISTLRTMSLFVVHSADAPILIDTKLYNCISYYSLPTNNIWYSYPEFDKQIKDWALKINKSCFTKFGRTGRKSKYTGKVCTFFITTDDKRCYKSVSCN